MLRPALELAALVAGAQQPDPAPVFAPPLGIPLTLRIERIQRTDAATFRFSAERRIVFTRTADGFRAEMTLERSNSDAVGPGARFDAAMAALRDVPMHVALDRDGAIVSIDDLDAHWTRFVAALAGPVDGVAAPPAIIAQLGTLPAEQRRAMLASALETAILAELAGKGVQAEHSIPMRPRPPYTSARPVTARYAVTAADDALVATTSAAFPVESPQGEAEMTIDDRTEIDPQTGLIRTSRETRSVTLTSGQRETTITSLDLSY
ncbi:hypothetical protein [Sphingomonas japonica]|uniref:DUF4412 domain-containing protein n=1 Tax=Sphingomonas japonica TaxID=511662 RepID=A0ABX0U3Q5_9SPHN|nr:hypothetical protein [Sphingomonas japonica]NIJ24306.1 hypothetical protein [Sphingomonas japonica]